MKINSIFKFIGENNSKYKNYKGIGEIDDYNLRQGYWEYYHQNGNLLAKGNYVNGKREGYWVVYWNNGEAFSKGFYLNGIKDGYWVEYFSSGEIWSKGTFVKGKFYEDKKNIFKRIKLFFK